MKKNKLKRSEPPAPLIVESPIDAEAAYRAVEDEILALAPGEVLHIAADIPELATKVLSNEPRIRAFLPAIEAQLPGFSTTSVTRLGTYARAAFYAHAAALSPPSDGDGLKVLVEEGIAARDDLLVGADALANRGYFDRKLLAKVRRGTGHRDLAVDLASISGMFKAKWSRIEGKTAITLPEVERAQQLSNELVEALGKRNAGRRAQGLDASEIRARAYTLLLRAYGQCRRAILYLRWNEGDADDIAPSLFKGRGGRRPAEAASDANGSVPLPSAPPAVAAPST